MNPRFRQLLEAFYESSGSPMVVNTSFNIRGEPIVCTPEDAFRCFMGTNMDVLVIDRFVIRKSEQDSHSESEKLEVETQQEYISQFPLD